MKITDKKINTINSKDSRKAVIIKLTKSLSKKHNNRIPKEDKVIPPTDLKNQSEPNKILKIINNTRTCRIEEIKNDIKKGVYHVKGELIAEKIIMESIFDDVIKKSKE